MLTDTLQRAEILHARHAVEPLVEERLGVRKDDLPIGVVLDLLIGLVADPYRPHAAIAVDRRFLPFDQRGFAAHSIDRLETATRRAVHDVAQIFVIAFQNIERPQPVERMHRVIGVEYTAIALVPVPARDRTRTRENTGAT